MENSGSFLKEKRKSKGLSLEQASDELRIRQIFLEALEEGKDELLPSPAYKKIFLKAYADYLGVNFEELVKMPSPAKAKAKEKEEPAFVAPVKKEVEPESEISVTKRKVRPDFLLVLAGLVLGAVIFLIFIMHQQIYYPGRTPESAIKQTGMGPSIPVTDSVKPESDSASKEAVKKIPSQPEEMILRLEGLEQTWAQVIGDEDTLFAGFIDSGMQVEYKAVSSFKLTLGRAWVVNGYLNGEKLKPFGLKGKSIFGREINRSNYQKFLDTTETKR